MNNLKILLGFAKRSAFVVFLLIFLSLVSFFSSSQRVVAADVPAQATKEGEVSATGVELPQFEASQPSASSQLPEGQPAEGAGTVTAAIEEEEMAPVQYRTFFWYGPPNDCLGRV